MKALVLTMMIALTGTMALATETTDTVKVIDNPNQVVITQNDGNIRMKVNGLASDSTYNYEYRVKQDPDGQITTIQIENSSKVFSLPFRRCKRDNTKPHFEMFLSDLYFGWGRTHVEPGYSDQISKSSWEAGVLNLIAAGYVFNANRSRLSLGLGFNWSSHRMKNPYFWSISDGITDVSEYNPEEYGGEIKNHSADLIVRSMQFPLMFSQTVNKKWNFAVGGVLNWNYYASVNNHFKVNDSHYDITTNGLHQRKVSFDAIAKITYKTVGVYFRYAPQSVFKQGWGPELKNRWALGIVLLGGW